MKKTLIAILLAIGITIGVAHRASAAPKPEDQLPAANEPFWGIMSQLERPDDLDCATVTANYFATSFGMPESEAATESSFACNGISQMPVQMQADMNAEGVTTNIFDQSNWHHVQNLYFQRTGHGKIEFTREIDFMSRDFMVFMGNFARKMEMRKGIIGLDADLVQDLKNAGAILTMYNVPDFSDPVILVDGEEDTEGVVSNLAYDPINHTLTFNAAHFTEFEAAERSSLPKTPKITKIKTEKYAGSTKKERIKVAVWGKNFKKSTDVKLGNYKAFKVTYKSSRKIIAHFSLEKLQKAGKDKLILRVINSADKTKKFKNKVDIGGI